MKVLWLSAHALNETQTADLSAVCGADVRITHVNQVFPAASGDAVREIVEASKGFDIVAGVFPAHIAAALARQSASAIEEGYVAFLGIWRAGERPLHVYSPVAKPASSDGGAARRVFEHSHWECLTKE